MDLPHCPLLFDVYMRVIPLALGVEAKNISKWAITPAMAPTMVTDQSSWMFGFEHIYMGQNLGSVDSLI